MDFNSAAGLWAGLRAAAAGLWGGLGAATDAAGGI